MSAVDITLLVSLIGSIVLFGGAAVLALGWAFRSGQFENFLAGSRSIFGPDEPIGEGTDWFPGADPAEADRAWPTDGDPDAAGAGTVLAEVVEVITESL
jgi:hypothetical protein